MCTSAVPIRLLDVDRNNFTLYLLRVAVMLSFNRFSGVKLSKRVR